MPSIDQRVVEMRFDNAQFEKGISTSMKSLNQLDEQLKFKGATDGLSNVQRAIDSFNTSAMASAVESIKNRFSTLGIIGMRVTENITDAMMSAAGKMVSGVNAVFEQIKSGGLSRALNLEQARFMLRGLLDDDLKKVESIINGPVLEAVKNTRFGLDEAAVAASNLFASGITDLDELKKSLQTISGVASMTNREYADMAQIFATVKSNGFLMTQQVRQFATYGLPLQAELAKYLKINEDQIPDMLKDHQITYDTMVDTLYHYWNVAAKANETYTGALANVKAALSRIGAEVQVPKLESFRKIFVALIPLIDKFNEELKPVYKIINGIIGKFSDLTVEFVSSQKTIKMVTRLVRSSINVWNALEETIKPLSDAFRTVFPTKFVKILRSSVKDFYNFTKTLGVTMATTTRLKSVFLGVFSSFKVGIEILRGFVTAVSPIIRVLGDLGRVALQVFGTIGRALFGFNEDLLASGDIASVAQMIADGLNAILPTSKAIKDWGNDISRTLKNILPSFDTVKSKFFEIKSTVEDFVKHFKDIAKEHIDFEWIHRFDGLLDGVKQRLQDIRSDQSALTGVLSSIKKALDSFLAFVLEVGSTIGKVFKPIFDGIRETVVGFTKDSELNTALKIINSGLFSGLLILLEKFIATMASDAKVFTTIGQQVKVLLATATASIKAMTAQINIGTLHMIAVAIATLAASAFALSLVDPKRVAGAMVALGTGFLGMMKAMKMMNGIGKGDNPFDTKKINAMARSMIVIGFALKQMAGAMKIMAKIDTDKFLTTIGLFTTALVELVGSMYALNKYVNAGEDGSKNLIAISGAMVIMAVAVRILAGAFKVMSKLDWEAIGKGVVGFIAALTPVVAAFLVLNRDKASYMQAAGAMVIMATGMTILVGAFRLMSGISWEGIAKGVVGFIAALTPIVATFLILNKEKTNFLGAAGAMTVMAIAMNLLVLAFKNLSELGWEAIARGFIAMAASLIVVVGAFYALNKIDGNLASLAASLTLFAVGVNILASAFKKFASVGWDGMAVGLLSMSGAIAVACIAFLALSKINGSLIKIGAAFVVLSVGVKILAEAFEIFAAVGWEGMATGLITLSGAMAVVVIAFYEMSEISGSMILTAAAFTVMAVGIRILASAVVLLASVDPLAALGSILYLAAALGTVVVIIYSLTGAIPVLTALAASISAIGLAILAAGGGIALVGVGMVLIGKGMQLMKDIDALKIAEGIVALAGALAALVVPGLAMLPVAPILLLLAAAIATMSFGSDSAAKGTQAFADALEALKRVDVQSVEDRMDVLSNAFDALSISANDVRPLTAFMEATADAIQTMYATLPSVMTNMVEFADVIKTMSKDLSNISFKPLEQAFDELTTSISSSVDLATPLRNLADSFLDLAEAGRIIAPLASRIVDMAEAMAVLHKVTPNTTIELGTFCTHIANMSRQLEDVSFVGIEEEMNQLAAVAGETSKKKEEIIELNKAIKKLAFRDEEIRPLSESFKLLADSVVTINDKLTNVTGKFETLAQNSAEINEEVKLIDMTPLASAVKELSDSLDNAIGKMPELSNLYQFFVDIGNTTKSINPLSSYVNAMSDAFVEMNEVIPSVTEEFETIIKKITDNEDTLNSTSFDGLCDELNNVYLYVDYLYNSADNLSDFSNVVKNLADRNTLLTPLADSFKSVCDSVTTLNDIILQISNKLFQLSQDLHAANNEFTSINWTDFIGQLSMMNDKIDAVIDGKDDFASLVSSFGELSGYATSVKTLSDAVSGVSNSIMDIYDKAPNAASRLSEFVSRTEDLSRRLNNVSFQDISNSFGGISVQVQNLLDKTTDYETFISDTYRFSDLGRYFTSLADNLLKIKDAIIAIKSDAKDAGDRLSEFVTHSTDLNEILNGIDFDKIQNRFKNFSGIVGEALKDASIWFKSFAEDSMSNLDSGFQSKRQSIEDAVMIVVNGIKNEFSKLKEKLKQVGGYAADGFIFGLKTRRRDIYDAAYDLGMEAKKAAMKALDEHSPSKEFMKIGAWAVEGFIIGVDKTSKKAIKGVRKFAKTIVKDFKDITTFSKYSGNLMDEYDAHLEKQVYNEKQASYAKQNLKNLKAAMVETYGYAKTSRDLTKSQTAELEYLQNVLIRDGELTENQFKRLGVLLGLNKKETKELYSELDSIEYYEKAIKRYNDAWKEQTSILAEIEKMMDDGLFNVSYDAIKGSTDAAIEAMEHLGKVLYKETDEYKENTAAIEANKAAITALKEERKELKEKMDTEKDSINAINDALDGSYARRKSKLALDKEEQAQLDAIQTKMKNGQKLTNKEINLLGLYLGLSDEEIRVLKEQNKEGISNLAYKKTKLNLDKKETAELEKLQKKLRKGKQLSEDELKRLGELLGLSKEQINNLVIEARERDKYAEALDKDKEAYKELGDAIGDFRDENASLKQEIEDGAITAFEDLYNTVQDTIKNALDPLNTALSDSIDLFSKFSTTAVDVDLDDLLTIRDKDYDEIQGLLGQIDSTKLNEKIKKELQNADKDTLKAWASLNEGEIEQINMRFNKGLVDNISSFADTWEEYEKKFAELQAMGFNDLMLDRIKSLGPAGLELIKSYLNFSDDEVKAANSAILRSTEATVDEWLTSVEDKGAKVKKFYDNLNVLRNSGLSNKAYQELLKQGADAAGEYVEALVNGPKDNIKRLNEAYKNMLEGSEDLATYAMEGAAASGQKAGESFREGFLSNFASVLSDEDYNAAIENILASVSKIAIDAITEEESEETQQAATDLATYYVDGMSTYFDEEGNLKVTTSATNLANNASDAVSSVINKKTGKSRGKNYATGVSVGLSDETVNSEVKSAGKTLGKSAKSGLTTYINYDKGEEIGEYMGEGLIDGFESKISEIKDAVEALAEAAYEQTLATLEVGSPSKKFMEIGMWCDLGFAKGIRDYASNVFGETDSIANGSMDAMREALASISETISETDNTPIIKPILDLSNVERGAIEMKRMMDSTVEARVGMASDEAAGGEKGDNGATYNYNFEQNNYSPKALSRIDIYRQTKNQFAMMKGVMA